MNEIYTKSKPEVAQPVIVPGGLENGLLDALHPGERNQDIDHDCHASPMDGCQCKTEEDADWWRDNEMER